MHACIRKWQLHDFSQITTVPHNLTITPSTFLRLGDQCFSKYGSSDTRASTGTSPCHGETQQRCYDKIPAVHLYICNWK